MPGIGEQDRRRMIGLHTGRLDQRQGSQRSQRSHDNHLKKMALEPGVHTRNIGRHTTAELMLQLLLKLSTIQNINTTPAISARRADTLILQDKIQHAELQYRSCFITHAIDREVRRTTTLARKTSKTPPQQVFSDQVDRMLNVAAPLFKPGDESSKEKKRRSLPERIPDITLTTTSEIIKDDVKLTEFPRFVIKKYESWNDVLVSIGKGGSKPFASLMKISNELYSLFTGKVIDTETKKFLAGLVRLSIA